MTCFVHHAFEHVCGEVSCFLRWHRCRRWDTAVRLQRSPSLRWAAKIPPWPGAVFTWLGACEVRDKAEPHGIMNTISNLYPPDYEWHGYRLIINRWKLKKMNVSAALITGAFCFPTASHILETDVFPELALLFCLRVELFGSSHPQIFLCPLYCPHDAALH